MGRSAAKSAFPSPAAVYRIYEGLYHVTNSLYRIIPYIIDLPRSNNALISLSAAAAEIDTPTCILLQGVRILSTRRTNGCDGWTPLLLRCVTVIGRYGRTPRTRHRRPWKDNNRRGESLRGSLTRERWRLRRGTTVRRRLVEVTALIAHHRCYLQAIYVDYAPVTQATIRVDQHVYMSF